MYVIQCIIIIERQIYEIILPLLPPMKNIRFHIVLAMLVLPSLLSAQPAGNIRGRVTDGASGRALACVTVTALSSNSATETTTDASGYFRLNGLPMGRHDIQFRCAGYEPAVYREIMVGSVKDVFVEMVMQESIHGLDEAAVRPKVNREAPLNWMALTDARMFSVDEASRYAGGFDDPARLATAFAGVSGGTNNNGIAVRGNPPQFVQWRIEGVESANPVHFSDITGVGGGIITALSTQVLGNSDFFTGAFPAEYGNALSGVFDMQLRNGNSQKYEHTAQIGTLGVEVASEGPFAKGKEASYLFSYRYSSMALLGGLLSDLIGDAAGMRYQDLSFKINLPAGRGGTFSVWGIGIIDHFLQRAPDDVSKWHNIFDIDADFRQQKAIGGIGHTAFTGTKAYLKSALAVNYARKQIAAEHVYTDKSKLEVTDMQNTNWNVAFNTYLNTKFSAAHTNRTGFNITALFFDLDYFMVPDVNRVPPGDMLHYAKGTGNSALFSAFSQSSFRLNSYLTANVGLLGMYFRLNGKATVEPRAGIRWQAFAKHAFGLAYGKHSQRETLDYYFVETSPEDGAFANKNLNFSKAHHLVVSYDLAISEHLHLKVEPYYQYLYDIPVEKDSRMSLINQRDFFMMLPLVNGGKGKNYGIDCTLEHDLHKGYYYLLTASLFDARCTGADGKWQHTRLDRNYILNALGGWEWKTGKQKQNILNVSLRFTLQGGERFIPVDEAESKAQRGIIYDHSQAYKERLPAEFITHLTAGYKINRNRLSHEITLKVINLTGNMEFGGYTYNYHTDNTEMYMSAGVIPNISYKIEF